jgi:DNA polymerase-3 subunit delta
MKLDYLQALKRVDEARGAWVLHGQEPLLEQNLIDAFRPAGKSRTLNVNAMTLVRSPTGKPSLMP